MSYQIIWEEEDAHADTGGRETSNSGETEGFDYQKEVRGATTARSHKAKNLGAEGARIHAGAGAAEAEEVCGGDEGEVFG